MNTEIETHLAEHGVKPTSVRLLLWRSMCGFTETFSLKDIEECMPHMDRSSIFRTLRLFTEHQMLHEIDDGSGQCKYCVCRCESDRHLGHVHFTCVACGKTYCFADEQIPQVELPHGFRMQEAEFVIKGICAACSEKNRTN